MSRKPRVEISAVRAPFFSSTVLIAMLNSCSTSSIAAVLLFSSYRLSAQPRVGSKETVEVLDVTMRPSTQPIRSVYVPPMSIPTTFIRSATRFASFLPAGEARLHEAHQFVEGNCHEGQRQYKSHQRGRVERFRI